MLPTSDSFCLIITHICIHTTWYNISTHLSWMTSKYCYFHSSSLSLCVFQAKKSVVRHYLTVRLIWRNWVQKWNSQPIVCGLVLSVTHIATVMTVSQESSCYYVKMRQELHIMQSSCQPESKIFKIQDGSIKHLYSTSRMWNSEFINAGSVSSKNFWTKSKCPKTKGFESLKKWLQQPHCSKSIGNLLNKNMSYIDA